MVSSMTGYGKASQQIDDKVFEIQIRTLNSKVIDINTRMPSSLQLQEKDFNIRKLLSERLVRGKVDFSLYTEKFSTENSNAIQSDIVRDYMDQLKNIVDCSEEDLLKMAVKMPNVISKKECKENEVKYPVIKTLIEKAIDELQEFRFREGRILTADLRQHIEKIKALLNCIEELDPKRLEKVRTRLEGLVSEISKDLDVNRLEQEMLYYIDKLDISEEKIRLATHLDFFLQTIDDDDISKGKKLGFIAQEIGREINTIGSKANDVEIQKAVVQMKGCLEKIKEQILNVL